MKTGTSNSWCRGSPRPRAATALLTIALVLCGQRPSCAQGVVFPADAGVVNVKQIGAKGDGRHDDTEALQKALDAHPGQGEIVYLPAGTYLITDTLHWPRGSGPAGGNTILQGQSEAKTVIRLKDASPGFADAKQPRPMISTGQAPAPRFRSAVRDLTLESGRRNLGAIGLLFVAHRQGCVRNVTIRSADGKALTGLDLAHAAGIGPLLVKNLRVIGFDYGIRAAHPATAATFEQVRLDHQNRFGIVNEGACLSLRGLESHNAVPALVNSGSSGLVVLLDSRLYGSRGAMAKPGVFNEAALFARNLETSGYQEAIRNTANQLRPDGNGRKVEEFVSHPALGLFPSRYQSLNLPVKETPELPWDDLRQWSSPTHFGAIPNDPADDTQAIQSAIDSGKSTVYFPRGSYQVSHTIVVRKNVRRLIGCEAQIDVAAKSRGPAFQVADGTSPALVFERFWAEDSRPITLQNASGRTLVVRDCWNICGAMTGKGDLFLEDVASSPHAGWSFSGQHVWARQLEVRNEGVEIRSAGGTLWILGLASRGGGTLMELLAGGKTELLGGLCRPATDPGAQPMFQVDGGTASLVIGEANVNPHAYSVLVSETQRSVRKMLKADQAPARAGGHMIPLYVTGVPE